MSVGQDQFSLRPATLDDIKPLFEIHRAALGNYVAATWGWDEKSQWDFFRHSCRPDIRSLIEVRRRVVGFIDVAERDGCLWLDNLELEPAHQGHGIGTRLIHNLIARAEKSGMTLKLQVLKVNARARALYDRLGFSYAGETATHVLMKYDREQPDK